MVIVVGIPLRAALPAAVGVAALAAGVAPLTVADGATVGAGGGVGAVVGEGGSVGTGGGVGSGAAVGTAVGASGAVEQAATRDDAAASPNRRPPARSTWRRLTSSWSAGEVGTRASRLIAIFPFP
jgi:hypothetical protein